MFRLKNVLILMLSLSFWYSTASLAQPETQKPFGCRKEVQCFIEAMHHKHRFNKKELTHLFNQFKTEPKVLALMSKQYEALPWYRYRETVVTQKRIDEGVLFWQQHKALLKKTEQQFGVPPEVIIAILGVETSYGQRMGKYPVLQALSTLAFDYKRRAPFFKSELEHFLLLTKEGSLDPIKAQGSFAGAIGMPQFMPSSYRRYAVDFSNKGKRDLIYNVEDVVGSVAYYLKEHGWKPNAKVAVLAKNPDVMKINKAKKEQKISLQSTPHQKEYWVGYQNFYTITRYNHSVHYAMAVYQLSQNIKQNYRKR